MQAAVWDGGTPAYAPWLPVTPAPRLLRQMQLRGSACPLALALQALTGTPHAAVHPPGAVGEDDLSAAAPAEL